MMKNRNCVIDILRSIGICLVILAHCISSKSLLHEIRTFDVVMLVFISGMSFRISFENKKIDKKEYIKSRFMKLILKTWLFLTLFFLIELFLKHTYPLYKIMQTYLLIGGAISYTWIFRIMFINAIINPLLLSITKKYNQNKLLILMFIALILNELIYKHITVNLSYYFSNILILVMHYTISYGLISLLGIIWVDLNIKKKNIVFVTLFIAFVINLIMGNSLALNANKYPPQLFYISYGVLWSIALYEVFSKLKSKLKMKIGIIRFISINSMDIYLLHILVLTYFKNNSYNKLVYYLLVLFISTFVIYIIQHMKDVIERIRNGKGNDCNTNI